MESDLGLEGRVYAKLSGMDHRVFWRTQRKLEHTQENKERPK